MGLVTNTLTEILQKQADKAGLVVWFDPERDYERVVSDLKIAGARIETYQGSFLELRRRIEDALAGEDAGHVVVYVPMEESATRNALVEAMAAGVVVRPGANPPQRNTRLAVVARTALRDVLPEDLVTKLERQIESGQLRLDDLEILAERGRDVGGGAVVVVFGTGNPSEIALSFLATTERDATLVEKGCVSDLAALLAAQYDVELDIAASPQQVRRAFARQIFATDLAIAFGTTLPAALERVRRPTRRSAVDAARALLHAWRHRRDAVQSYVELADLAEQDLGLAGLLPGPEVLERLEGFRWSELALIRHVERSLVAAPAAAFVALAERRQGAFWASALPTVMERWALLAAIGRLLLACERVLIEVGGAGDAADVVRGYTVGADGSGEPWRLLDTFHRHMERRIYQFDIDVRGSDADLEGLIARARGRYRAATSKLAERFLDGVRATAFRIPALPRQVETYSRFVSPRLDTGRVAYVLVDALRYEMAAELRAGLGDGFDADLSCVLGTLPSITEVGMAALVPGADRGAELVAAGEGKLALRIEGTLVRTRAERMAFLAGHSGRRTMDTKLEDILPASKKTREQIDGAELIVVTATDELDGLCEKGNVAMARRLMDDVLLQLRRALGVLFDLGIDSVVVTADHGFLFGEEMESDSKIDPPGGKTADLHRRVWVGRGGAESESYVRLTAREVGLGGDLEIAVPRSIACFKAVGATAYFHGGASPQELLVPVLTVHRVRRSQPSLGDVAFSVSLGSKVISTRFLSVQVEGQVTSLFRVAPLAVRVEVREGKEARSRAVSASYGFNDATGVVQLELAEDGRKFRPVTITLMLDNIGRTSVDVALVDAATERTLKTVEKIDVAIMNF